MYSSSDEIILHAPRAFDLCRELVYNYEDCRQLDYQGRPNPELCAGETLDLMKCYNKVEEVEPVCLTPMNKFRECFFKYSSNVVVCEKEIEEFNRCQENPKWYADKVMPRLRGHFPSYDSTRVRAKY